MKLDLSIDHVAVEVGDFDARLEFLTDRLGLDLRRTGRLSADPERRIAMLADRRGVKIELVEGAPGAADRILHVAFDTTRPDAVDTAFRTLLDAGCTVVTEPRRFEPARSRTASVAAWGGMYQLVAYDADSPDRSGPVDR